MARRNSGGRPSNALISAFIWAAIFVSPTILAHELMHYVTALSLGFDPTLHFSAVDPGPTAGKPAWMSGAIGLAGPAMTLILTSIGILAASRRRNASWPPALAMAAASRFAVGLPYTVINLIMTLQGQHLAPPAFDEFKAASALGWSGNLLLGITSAISVLVLIWVAKKTPKGSRFAVLLALLSGTALGWYLWMGLLGPRLLP